MNHEEIDALLKGHIGCDDARDWLSRYRTAEDAWEACTTPVWMSFALWAIGQESANVDDLDSPVGRILAEAGIHSCDDRQENPPLCASIRAVWPVERFCDALQRETSAPAALIWRSAQEA